MGACLAVEGGGGGDGRDGLAPPPGALRALLTGRHTGAEVTALIGGCPRPVALALMRRLEAEGVPAAEVLFGDPYF